jgi:DTW domain-containing protein YfiP
MRSALPPIPPPRLCCAACELPHSTCICHLVSCIANRVEVLVLQHPQEAREAKGSVRLLRLSLAHCRVVVGEVFGSVFLESLLHADGRRNVLLYPADTCEDDDAGWRRAAGGAPSRLVVLDGTWRKSLKMLKSNPLLQALPRLSLGLAATSRYGALRKARRPHQLSTLEATCAGLALIDDDAQRCAPLLSAFDRFVAEAAARATSTASLSGETSAP